MLTNSVVDLDFHDSNEKSFDSKEKSDDLLSFCFLQRNQQANLDDYVQAKIYLVENETSRVFNNSIAELSSSSAELSTSLQLYYKTLIRFYQHQFQFISNYSWTSSVVFLVPKYSKLLNKHYLDCHIHIGDNSSEEWLTCLLFSSFTKKYSNVAVSIRDQDEEFLAIEAAEHIPKSLTPSNSENRIFLRNGLLCTLDPATFSVSTYTPTAEGSADINLNQALLFLKQRDLRTTAGALAQLRIRQRLLPFESVIKAWIHKNDKRTISSVCDELKAKSSFDAMMCLPQLCHAVLPERIAELFSTYPNLISVSLEHLPPPKRNNNQVMSYSAFLSGIHNSPSQESNNDNIVFHVTEDTRLVRMHLFMNRCQYARLSQLHFQLPKEFTLSSWNVENRNTPSSNASEINSNGAMDLSIEKKKKTKFQLSPDDYLEKQLGAKLCLGLYIAFQCRTRGNSPDILAFFWKSGVSSIEHQFYHFFTLLDQANANEKQQSSSTISNKITKHSSSTVYRNSAPFTESVNWLKQCVFAFQKSPEKATKYVSQKGHDESFFQIAMFTEYIKKTVIGITSSQTALDSVIQKEDQTEKNKKIENNGGQDYDDENLLSDLPSFNNLLQYCYSQTKKTSKQQTTKLRKELEKENADNSCPSITMEPKETDVSEYGYSISTCIDSTCVSDSNDWMDINEYQVETFLADRQKDEQLKNFIHKHSEKKKDSKLETDAGKTTANVSLLGKMESFFNDTSTYKGISNSRSLTSQLRKLSGDTVKKIQAAIPENLLEEFEAALADMHGIGSSSEENTVSSDFSDEQDFDTKESEDYFWEAEAAMEEELGQITTTVREEDGKSKEVPFRSHQPSKLTSEQLEEIVKTNLDKAKKQEQYNLTMGPSSVLLQNL